MALKNKALAGMAIKDDDIEKVSGGSLEDICYTKQDTGEYRVCPYCKKRFTSPG